MFSERSELASRFSQSKAHDWPEQLSAPHANLGQPSCSRFSGAQQDASTMSMASGFKKHRVDPNRRPSRRPSLMAEATIKEGDVAVQVEGRPGTTRRRASSCLHELRLSSEKRCSVSNPPSMRPSRNSRASSGSQNETGEPLKTASHSSYATTMARIRDRRAAVRSQPLTPEGAFESASHVTQAANASVRETAAMPQPTRLPFATAAQSRKPTVTALNRSWREVFSNSTRSMAGGSHRSERRSSHDEIMRSFAWNDDADHLCNA